MAPRDFDDAHDFVASELDLPRSLPVYSPSRETWDVPEIQAEHVFTIEHKKTGVPWLTLATKSRATSNNEQPVFYQGDDVAGSVRLDLTKEEYVDDITIALCGKLTVYTRTTTTPSNFLQMSHKLYAAADDPSTSIFRRGRLTGKHTWDFSFRLPKGVSIPSTNPSSGQQRQTYRLPPAFKLDEGGVVIEYQLVVRVNRAGFRSGSKLVVPFEYVPMSRPVVPTVLRQLAYQENMIVADPGADPDGWKSLEPVVVNGSLFKTVPVTATCRLSISRPLVYPRGAPIHLHLKISSDNGQFLDLLNPQSLHVSLLQVMRFGEDIAFRPRISQRLEPQQFIKTFERAAATWWRTDDPAALPSTRTFSGEIQVPECLVPACEILHYAHEYQLHLRPLSAIGFAHGPPAKDALLSTPVGIVTAFAQGPRPRSYAAAPEYSAPAR